MTVVGCCVLSYLYLTGTLPSTKRCGLTTVNNSAALPTALLPGLAWPGWCCLRRKASRQAGRKEREIQRGKSVLISSYQQLFNLYLSTTSQDRRAEEATKCTFISHQQRLFNSVRFTNHHNINKVEQQIQAIICIVYQYIIESQILYILAKRTKR